MPGLVTEGLPPHVQEQFAELAAAQQAHAELAAVALRATGGEGYYGLEVALVAADVLDNYAQGRFAEPGFDDDGTARVPLYVPVGEHTFTNGVRGVASLRVPILGSPNAFGMRPKDPDNLVNQAAFYAMTGMNTNNALFTNTGTNEGNVTVVDRQRDLANPTGHRLVPVDSEGVAGAPAGATIVVAPEFHQVGIVGANADNPIGLGTVNDAETGELRALVHVNGGWQNLNNRVAEQTGEALERLGLVAGHVIRFAVGPGARYGFEVRTSRLETWNAGAVGFETHDHPEKSYLELTLAAERAVQSLTDIPVETLPLCTVRDGSVNNGHGFLHSSRVERTGPTPPGQNIMAGGDRGLTAILAPNMPQPLGTQPEGTR